MQDEDTRIGEGNWKAEKSSKMASNYPKLAHTLNADSWAPLAEKEKQNFPRAGRHTSVQMENMLFLCGPFSKESALRECLNDSSFEIHSLPIVCSCFKHKFSLEGNEVVSKLATEIRNNWLDLKFHNYLIHLSKGKISFTSP